MKLTSTIFLLTAISLQSFSQSGQWVWMKGDTISNATPVWGTKGVGAPANTPARKYTYFHWQDTAGNFWIYSGVESDNPYNGYNDVWKFDLQSQNWIWMHGDTTFNSPAVYGVKGVPAANNTPGRRYYLGLSWTGKDGKFWMIGGYPSGSKDIMMMYDPSINEWTWMSGSISHSTSPHFGTKGIASPDNSPGFVTEINASWVDDDEGNLWFYGNGGLWKYDVGTLEWTWVNGDSIYHAPVYGTLGVPSTSNKPGTRYCHSSWKDDEGNFWLFGGRYTTMTSGQTYNDLWKYSPSTNEWTWMSGDSAHDQPGIAGSECEFSPSFFPAARFENRACAKDSCGNFWMYGGYSSLCDLWIYRPQSNDWASMGDTTHHPHYGIKGVPAQVNTPGQRWGSVTWFDHSGNMWLFGGGGLSRSGGGFITRQKQDLWKYIPDNNCATNACAPVNCPPPTLAQVWISAGGATTFCSGSNVSLTIATSGLTYQWKNNGSPISGATLQNYTASASGSFSCAVNNSCGTTTSYPVTVTVQTPLTASQAAITAGGATTFCSGGNVLLTVATSGLIYQWKKNGSTISGATTKNYYASSSGAYTCVVSNICGSITSNSITVTVNSTPTAEQATITAGGSTTFCKNQSVVLTVAAAGFTYQWKKGNANIAGATMQSYTATKTGTFKCFVSNSCGSITSNSISVTVNPSPTASVSAAPCSGGAVLLTCTFTPSSGVTFQWTKANVNVSGATNSTYSATVKGTYKCLVTITATGCTKLSNGAKVTITCKDGELVNDDKLIVYPNPSLGIFTLEISASGDLSIEIQNVIGQVISSSEEKNIDGNLKKQIDLSGQASGIYFLTVKNSEQQWVEKILIE